MWYVVWLVARVVGLAPCGLRIGPAAAATLKTKTKATQATHDTTPTADTPMACVRALLSAVCCAVLSPGR
jgi:hypothetical protein